MRLTECCCAVSANPSRSAVAGLKTDSGSPSTASASLGHILAVTSHEPSPVGLRIAVMAADPSLPGRTHGITRRGGPNPKSPSTWNGTNAYTTSAGLPVPSPTASVHFPPSLNTPL